MLSSLHQLAIDAAIINRIFTENLLGGFAEGWRELQKEYLDLAETQFHPIPILRAPFNPSEMLGYEKLLALGGDLYGKMKARRTRYRSFFDHLSNARIEMLRAFRSLVDAGIAAIEKRKSREEDEKRATRIEVE